MLGFTSFSELPFSTQPGSQEVSLPLIGSAVVLHEPTITTGAVTATLPLISSTENTYSPTITTGAVTVTLPTLSSQETLLPPLVSTGSVTLTLPLISSTETLYAPIATLDSVTALILPTISSGETLYDPTLSVGSVDLTLPLLANSNTMSGFEVALVTDAELELPLIASTETLSGFSVAISGSGVELYHIDSVTNFTGFTVTTGSVSVTLPLNTNANTLYAPESQAVYGITTPELTTSNVLYNQTLTTSAVTVELPHFHSSTVHTPYKVDNGEWIFTGVSYIRS